MVRGLRPIALVLALLLPGCIGIPWGEQPGPAPTQEDAVQDTSYDDGFGPCPTHDYSGVSWDDSDYYGSISTQAPVAGGNWSVFPPERSRIEFENDSLPWLFSVSEYTMWEHYEDHVVLAHGNGTLEFMVREIEWKQHRSEGQQGDGFHLFEYFMNHTMGMDADQIQDAYVDIHSNWSEVIRSLPRWGPDDSVYFDEDVWITMSMMFDDVVDVNEPWRHFSPSEIYHAPASTGHHYLFAYKYREYEQTITLSLPTKTAQFDDGARFVADADGSASMDGFLAGDAQDYLNRTSRYLEILGLNDTSLMQTNAPRWSTVPTGIIC